MARWTSNNDVTVFVRTPHVEPAHQFALQFVIPILLGVAIGLAASL